MKFVKNNLKRNEYRKALETVHAKRLYELAGVNRTNYARFSAHIGIVIVYGALADSKSTRRVQVSPSSGGDSLNKPIVYLTIDAHNTKFFSKIGKHLKRAQINAMSSEQIAAYFETVELSSNN